MFLKSVVYLSVFLSVSSNQFAFAAGTAQKPHHKPASPAKGSGGWNSGLSDMMDQIESQVGPGKTKNSAPPTDTTPTPPPPAESQPKEETAAPPVVPTENPPVTFPKFPDASTSSGSSSSDLPPEPKSETEAAADKVPAVVPNVIGPTGPNYYGELEKVGLMRWDRSRFPVKIFIEQTSTAKGFRPEFAAILKQAFKEWDAMIPAVPIEFISDPTYSQISCKWTDNKSDLMSSQEGGNTVVVPDEMGIMHADMKIYTLPPSGLSTVPANFMRRVALHEVGHAFGITGHSAESNDVMFGIVYPKDETCALTTRDKNTMIVLYQRPIPTGQKINLQIKGDTTNPKVRAMQLSNEAASAMQENKIDVAEAKLSEAHKLDPTNRVISGNLGAIYTNFGSMAAMTFQAPLAMHYFKQAVPLLEQSDNKTAFKQLLQNYLILLRNSKDAAELKRIQAKLNALPK